MTPPTRTGRTIAIAGATGFIGRRLCARLRDAGHRVVGIGRSVLDGVSRDGVLWRKADLFSLLQCEQALEGVDELVYLVHSMAPTARLTQASFEDMDLILADNMSRAARKMGLERIVYLGGLVPDDSHISRHLSSRQEVEDVLAGHGVPVTSLRAGLVIGPEGSSFAILERLVRRLPVLALPKWTRQACQPISLDDILDVILGVIRTGEAKGKHIDVGGPTVLTYRQLLVETARAMGVKRRFIDLPVGSPFLSEMWVTAITGQPRSLTGPLIESLDHSMVAGDLSVQHGLGIIGDDVPTALRRALAGETRSPTVSVPRAPRAPARPDVRSVQRMRLPPGRDAMWAAEAYLRWLPEFLSPLVRVENTESASRICTRGPPLMLLELTPSDDRSTADRALLYVTDGRLARVRDPVRGRLEMRTVGDGSVLLAAIHDFEPRLPWPVYRTTQAKAHLVVMSGFRRYLALEAQKSQPVASQ